jgi:hypothetical protein
MNWTIQVEAVAEVYGKSYYSIQAAGKEQWRSVAALTDRLPILGRSRAVYYGIGVIGRNIAPGKLFVTDINCDII